MEFEQVFFSKCLNPKLIFHRASGIWDTLFQFMSNHGEYTCNASQRTSHVEVMQVISSYSVNPSDVSWSLVSDSLVTWMWSSHIRSNEDDLNKEFSWWSLRRFLGPHSIFFTHTILLILVNNGTHSLLSTIYFNVPIAITVITLTVKIDKTWNKEFSRWSLGFFLWYDGQLYCHLPLHKIAVAAIGTLK